MKLSIDDLKLFYYVVEFNGFTKAANFLGVSKSLISKKIAKLERDYGVILMHRKQRKILLTEAGKAILPLCTQLVANAQRVEEALQYTTKKISGSIRLSSPQLIGELLSASFIPQFCQQYPDISIDLQLGAKTVDIAAEKYDLVIRSQRLLADSAYIQRFFMTCKFIVCARANSDQIKYINQLINISCAVYATDVHGSSYTWPFIKNNQEIRAPVKQGFISNQWTSLKNFTINSNAILHAPYCLVADAINKKELQELSLDYPVSNTKLYILYLERELMPRYLRIFIDELLSWAKNKDFEF